MAGLVIVITALLAAGCGQKMPLDNPQQPPTDAPEAQSEASVESPPKETPKAKEEAQGPPSETTAADDAPEGEASTADLPDKPPEERRLTLAQQQVQTWADQLHAVEYGTLYEDLPEELRDDLAWEGMRDLKNLSCEGDKPTRYLLSWHQEKDIDGETWNEAYIFVRVTVYEGRVVAVAGEYDTAWREQAPGMLVPGHIRLGFESTGTLNRYTYIPEGCEYVGEYDTFMGGP